MYKLRQSIVDFTVFLILLIHKIFIKPICAHFGGMYVQSDPIQTVSNETRLSTTERPPTWHYHLPVLVLFLTFSYGTVGLYYESNHTEKQFNWRELQSAPYVFTHRVCPQAIWAQMDFCFILDWIAANFIYAMLAYTKHVDKKYRFYKVGDKIIIGSMELNTDECGKIIRLRDRIKSVLLSIISVHDVGWTSYFLIKAWLTSTSILNWRLFLYWLVIFPAGLYYIYYAVFATVIYAVLASRYIRIRQKELIGKFVDIIQTVDKTNLKKAPVKLLLAFEKYKQANTEIVEMGKLIGEYSRYCKPILSVIIPFFITAQCYLLYIVLYVKYSFFEKCMVFIAILECNLNMFVIIHECSRVVKLCSHLEVLNRKFYLSFLHHGGFDLLNNAYLFKAHSFQLCRRLRCYSFRLFGNYRITSKTYYLILSYISAYFVFMFKKQYSI